MALEIVLISVEKWVVEQQASRNQNRSLLLSQKHLSHLFPRSFLRKQLQQHDTKVTPNSTVRVRLILIKSIKFSKNRSL